MTDLANRLKRHLVNDLRKQAERRSLSLATRSLLRAAADRIEELEQLCEEAAEDFYEALTTFSNWAELCANRNDGCVDARGCCKDCNCRNFRWRLADRLYWREQDGQA